MNTLLRKYGPKKIYIIDDDPDIRENMRAFFELEDYKVASANNGEEALRDLIALSDQDLPDLVFLDYMMPVMDGARFNEARMLDKRLSRLPVVMVTASGRDRELSQELLIDACLSKTGDLDKLSHVAFNFIHRRKNSEFSFIC